MKRELLDRITWLTGIEVWGKNRNLVGNAHPTRFLSSLRYIFGFAQPRVVVTHDIFTDEVGWYSIPRLYVGGWCGGFGRTPAGFLGMWVGGLPRVLFALLTAPGAIVV